MAPQFLNLYPGILNQYFRCPLCVSYFTIFLLLFHSREYTVSLKLQSRGKGIQRLFIFLEYLPLSDKWLREMSPASNRETSPYLLWFEKLKRLTPSFKAISLTFLCACYSISARTKGLTWFRYVSLLYFPFLKNILQLKPVSKGSRTDNKHMKLNIKYWLKFYA